MQVFNVQGMSCGHCVKAITQALQAKDPAASVRVDLAAKEVGVESALTADQVIAAISGQGAEIIVGSPEDLGNLVKAERERLGLLIRNIGATEQ